MGELGENPRGEEDKAFLFFYNIKVVGSEK
jgi:hypothetical protein